MLVGSRHYPFVLDSFSAAVYTYLMPQLILYTMSLARPRQASKEAVAPYTVYSLHAC